MMMTIFILIVYFAIMIGIGIIAGRRVKNSEGFYLGGKSFGPWFTAFKFAATLESGTKLVGTPGMAYGIGYAAFLQGMFTPFAYFLSFRVFGQRMKTACEHYNVITVPQLLEKRYNTKLIRSLAAIAILVGLGGSLVAQFKATGEIFSGLLGTSYVTSLFIGVLIVGIYSTVGGYLATVWTDLVQGIIMVFGVIVLLIGSIKATFGTVSIGFLSDMNAKLAEIAPTMLEIDGGGKMPVNMIVVMCIIGIIVGVAQPQQAVALFSMKDAKVAKSAMIIATVFSSILIWCLIPSAMMGRIILEPGAVTNPDALMPVLTQRVLGPALSGIFMAAILSAIMSTVSGLIVVAASAVSQDIMKIAMPERYEKNQVMWDRLAAGSIVAICLIMAIKPPAIIFWIVVFAFGFTVFTFIMPILGTVLWKRATGKAAVVQMIATMVVIPLWGIIGPGIAPKIPSLMVGMIVAPVVFIIVTLLTKNDHTDELDSLWDAYHAIDSKVDFNKANNK
jgi:sodium/proline symporter